MKDDASTIKQLVEDCKNRHESDHKPAHATQPVGDRPRDCQHGHDDVCLMAQFDGVCCPDESCDIDDGIRKPPEAATQPAGEWVTEEELANCVHVLINHDKSGYGLRGVFELNALLTDKFGPRTYNGEPASEWGLADDAWVLVFSDGRYIDMRYAHLRKGDQWMMQLPAPKPTTED